ncbi:hypothetical protein PpBr36_02321 [Pyricularia pennisetigena]|uniref:hypothetical protein n=1 Tax=Pyricularia pennisetigena TaxID=1578925 RepID=UPI00115089EA|nr:hypothetical protein PpBr36_02321 [Pyricularia pennisetigena]TLS30418.1 hypothetical protein PpBr36_02321 [Pyricularia pennisetigena]
MGIGWLIAMTYCRSRPLLTAVKLALLVVGSSVDCFDGKVLQRNARPEHTLYECLLVAVPSVLLQEGRESDQVPSVCRLVVDPVQRPQAQGRHARLVACSLDRPGPRGRRVSHDLKADRQRLQLLLVNVVLPEDVRRLADGPAEPRRGLHEVYVRRHRVVDAVRERPQLHRLARSGVPAKVGAEQSVGRPDRRAQRHPVVLDAVVVDAILDQPRRHAADRSRCRGRVGPQLVVRQVLPVLGVPRVRDLQHHLLQGRRLLLPEGDAERQRLRGVCRVRVRPASWRTRQTVKDAAGGEGGQEAEVNEDAVEHGDFAEIFLLLSFLAQGYNWRLEGTKV